MSAEREEPQVADDVEETGLAHTVALDALIDASRALEAADIAVTRAKGTQTAAFEAYSAALDRVVLP